MYKEQICKDSNRFEEMSQKLGINLSVGMCLTQR